MFVDLAQVKVAAGKGGDGVVSFRREVYVDKGGPDGGDGGRGGNVVFEATKSLNTLVKFRFQPELKADPGKSGAKANRTGRSGQDLVVKVPVGTIIKRDEQILADLTEDGQRAIIAKGGAGGFGNAHFKSSTRQVPKVAEKGEPGEEFLATLELKLLADVGLIGLPNAGKSTFLSVVTNAKPEIADYEFTTLEPNLGVATVDGHDLLIADIPGLIEGASQGKGLGAQFLRHVERTAVLLHLVDAYQEDPATVYQIIRQELEAHSENLASLPEVVVLTKTEGFDQELLDSQLQKLQRVVPKNTPVLALSAVAHLNLQPVLRQLLQLVQKQREFEAKEAEATEAEAPQKKVFELTAEQKTERWQVEKTKKGVFKVTGVKIGKFAQRTHFDDYHGRTRLRDILAKMGIERELLRQGAEPESILEFNDDSNQRITLEEVDD